MFILAAKFSGSDEVKYFVSRTLTPLKRIRAQAIDYRVWNDGWIDSKTENSWKEIGQEVVGKSALVVI